MVENNKIIKDELEKVTKLVHYFLHQQKVFGNDETVSAEQNIICGEHDIQD